MKKESVKRELLGWAKTLAVAVLLVFLVNTFFVINAQIPSASMENTLMVHDRLLVSRMAYLLEEPERGDIVVFHSPQDGQLLIKRIIGLPGETVEGKNGVVYADNAALREDYCKPCERLEPIAADFGPFEVPEGCYFVMGDNRANSYDSRYWEQHYVPRERIAGKAVFKYYPRFELLD